MKATYVVLGVLLLFMKSSLLRKESKYNADIFKNNEEYTKEQVSGLTCLIIPEELPTILSLVYSNIPPIKKGTDSRLGLGFSLGEHADFQVVLELGPQTETEPIGNSNNDSKIRRAAILDAAVRGKMGPWAEAVAKYQMQRKLGKDFTKLMEIKKKYENEEKNKGVGKKSEASEWLSKWSKGIVEPELEQFPEQKNLPNISRLRVVKQRKNKEPSPTDNKDTSEVIMKEFKKLYETQKSIQ